MLCSPFTPSLITALEVTTHFHTTRRRFTLRLAEWPNPECFKVEGKNPDPEYVVVAAVQCPRLR